MSDEDEKKALMEELDRLRAEADARERTELVENDNSARQREIIARLADLGVQLG